VTPAVRAALLEVVAVLPGATVTADQLDGSPVVALSVAGGNQVVTLLLDPTDARLVGARGTATAPIEQSGLLPGELVFERTYTTLGFVDRIGARP
jgi:hypothetical protein